MRSDISFHAWRAGELGGGTHLGTEATDRGLRMADPVGTRRYTDPPTDQEPRDYEWSAWVSPTVEPGHRFDFLVPSWNARTPDDSWLEFEVRVSLDGLRWSRWHSLGCWAETDAEIHRTSRPGQSDDEATVRVDVLSARSGVTWSAYQLRLVLHRRPGSAAVPEVSLVGASVSARAPDPAGSNDPPGDPGGAAHGTEMRVPAYSQQIHRGEYPQWGGGGEAWCSPTATSMLLGHWGLGPSQEEYDWVDPSYADRFVDHAAWNVFDHAYAGAGNWPFSAAYAARYGAEAFVTQLRSLAEAELFIAAGIPLVASVSFTSDELDGAGYDTAGHLLTIIGFDDEGRVICNDPASHGRPDNTEVRVVFDRTQLERSWLNGSGGIVYVVRPHDVALPEPPDPHRRNW